MLEMSDSRVIDRNAEAAGVTVSTLMENAGKCVADLIETKFGDRKHIVFVCGPGNNGGDGFVAAGILSRSRKTSVILMRGSTEAQQRPHLKERLDRVSGLVGDASLLESPGQKRTLIVDCLLGSGISRPPSGEFRNIIQSINEARTGGAAVVSVDVPSGFPFDEHVKPDVTITFTDKKSGMNESNSGRIVVADIGIPDRALKYTGPGEMELYPVPEKYSHKGNNGIVTVIGGGVFSGAAVFSSLAAYRTGADLVYTFVPESSLLTVASFSPSIMAFPVEERKVSSEDIGRILLWAEKSGSALIGPGTDASSHDFITEVIRRISCPLVIDAGGIEAAGKNHAILSGKDAVITPHSMEFYKLTGAFLEEDIESRKSTVMKWASKLGVTILLKGAVDIISDGRRTRLNETGNAGMTVGGTGDVLAGIVAALMSKGLSGFDAARLGAYMNGCAGDICFMKKSYGLVASDVIEAIPEVLISHLGVKR